MNCYSRLDDVKAELQGGGSGTSNDTVLLRGIERVSRAIEETLNGRHFYSRQGTLVLPEVDRTRFNTPEGCQLWIEHDVISITTLKRDDDGDFVYETTLTTPTDYWTWPYNKLTHEPIARLDLVSTTWPTSRRRVELVSKIGYSEETQAAGTIAAAMVDTTGTSITMAGSHGLSAGDTIIIDSEQMDVSVVATNTLTVTRGINGTTAATHLVNAPVSRRRFPREIEQACVMQTVRFFREIQTGYGGSIGNSDFAGYSFSSMYPAIRDLLRPYRRERSRVA